jgi:hypothetical protein
MVLSDIGIIGINLHNANIAINFSVSFLNSGNTNLKIELEDCPFSRFNIFKYSFRYLEYMITKSLINQEYFEIKHSNSINKLLIHNEDVFCEINSNLKMNLKIIIRQIHSNFGQHFLKWYTIIIPSKYIDNI